MIADYAMRLSRDQRRLEVPERTAPECAKILRQLDPRSSRGWRAYVSIVLGAILGGRSNAILHLEWRDIDLKARTIRWRPELDKLGKDRVQPLPRDAVRVLRIARVWRQRIGYDGPFVLPRAGVGTRDLGNGGYVTARSKSRAAAKSDRPYTYSALHDALRRAADRAKVRWIGYRAMHGFQRVPRILHWSDSVDGWSGECASGRGPPARKRWPCHVRHCRGNPGYS